MDDKTGYLDYQRHLRCPRVDSITDTRCFGDTQKMSARQNIATSDRDMRKLINIVQSRLRENKQVRRHLPQGGRIHIDRALPFLCVYRRPPKRGDLGTEKLVMSEASYIVARGGNAQKSNLTALIHGVVEVLSERFGNCMILEIWAGAPRRKKGPLSLHGLSPGFKLITSESRTTPWFLERFEDLLRHVTVTKSSANVEVSPSERCAPPGWAPLLSTDLKNANGYRLFGLEVSPIYRDPDSGQVFPLVLREHRQALSKALRSVFYDFTRTYTTHPVTHRHALGRRAMVKALWEADRILAEVSNRFDFLLQVTPVNGDRAWRQFKKLKYEKQPLLKYRPTPFEPVVLKRLLYRAPVEKIEDPALALLFRQKLTELERQITLQQDRNTPEFIHVSAQLYGVPSESLVKLANRLIEEISPRSRESSGKNVINAEAFAARAVEEIEYYRAQYPALTARVELRDDVAGLMVSQGSLLVSRRMSIPVSRVDALLQHEIGTHVLTYHNGKSQRLKQLSAGLAGYDALQEGLAVLSEYLVGGLSKSRLRLLAGRVKAAHNVINGAGFVENFRVLNRECGFSERTAFMISMRTHRGGGLTKDAVYLEGLVHILEYLAEGGELDTLFVGKIGQEHIPIIRELLWRGVLTNPPLKPRYMDRPEVLSRLKKLQNGASVLDLVRRRKK